MKEELKTYGVVDVERAMSMRDGNLTPNGHHIVIFDQRKMPTEVNVGYMRHNVRVYYPRPLRCSKCCKFQHTRKRCPEREMACRNCNADAQPGIQCSTQAIYVNMEDRSDHNAPFSMTEFHES
jgi:hypothetical protein